jgi:membrane protease YdiL (CAAX protease family)
MDLTLVTGFVVSAAAMGSVFAFGRRQFWRRATVAGVVIGIYGAIAEHERIVDYVRPSGFDVVAGAAAAVLLYLVFVAGDRLLVRFLPALSPEVDDLYRLRSESGRGSVLVMIATVAACEEVFWRGFVQARTGLLVATAGYALVLIWERKLVLLVAAVICGATWGALFAWRDTLVTPLVSHVLWDLAIMGFLPVRKTRDLIPRAPV